MNSAFITRDIDTKSPFYTILTDQQFNVDGRSFIEFTPVNISSLPDSDWIFFYSKNGIRFFFEQIQLLGLAIDDINSKWATIGKASALYLEHFGIKADFIGNGEPNATAKTFLQVAKNQLVLFPRATNSKKSIQNILQNDINAIDLIIYNNFIDNNIKDRDEAFLVFTSPLNAQAYFKSCQLKHFQKVIAIGRTTSKALKELNIDVFAVSPQPSEKSLAETILQIVRDSSFENKG